MHLPTKARFKRRASAVRNSIDRIKLNFSTAVGRPGFKSRAAAVPRARTQFIHYKYIRIHLLFNLL